MLQIGSNFDTIRKRITYFKTDAEDAANCVGIYPFLRVLRDFQDFQDLPALMDHQWVHLSLYALQNNHIVYISTATQWISCWISVNLQMNIKMDKRSLNVSSVVISTSARVFLVHFMISAATFW